MQNPNWLAPSPLEPQGFTGFGAGHYAPTAAWPLDACPQDDDTVRVLNRLGYLGPGAWADTEGGLLAAGMLDAPV